MRFLLAKNAILGVAILFRVTTSWAQTLTPTQTPVCTDDTWTPTSVTNAPSARSLHKAVWTGTEMIVWGGDNPHVYPFIGGRYNLDADTWRTTSTPTPHS